MKRVIAGFAAHVLLLFLLLPVVAGAQVSGLPGPVSGIVGQVEQLPPVTFPSGGPGGQLFQTPLGFDISLQHYEDLKLSSPPPFPVGSPQRSVDVNTSLPAQTGASFPGPVNNGWIPYDAALAVGPAAIVAMVNSSITVYGLNGNQQFYSDFDTFFGKDAGSPFDPKCFYDGNHFGVLATAVGNGKALMYLAVSTDASTWTKYTMDWTLDGTTPTQNWGDFPGLGYDNNYIYINANQYSMSANSFQYAKVRAIDKQALFGSATTPPALVYWDFVQLANADGTLAFTVKPARALGNATTGYLLNTRPSGGSSVTLWTMAKTSSGPALTRAATVSVSSYAVPPDAPQAGGRNLVNTGDCRTQDIVANNNVIYTAFTERIGSTRKTQQAAVRYLEIGYNSGVASLRHNITQQGLSGIHFYYPAVTVNSSGTVYLVYNRSSANEYISFNSATLASGATTFVPSLLAAGSTYMTQSRWGDYSAVHNVLDSSGNPGATVYGFGGVGTSRVWGTVVSTLP